MNRLPAAQFSLQPPVAILGIPFDPVTSDEAIARIEQMIASRRPHHLVTANVDFLVQALHDVELRRILIDADMVLCDGTPLVWVSRLLRNPLPERVAGSDLTPLLIERAAEKGYRVYFLGGDPETAERAVRRVCEAHPGLLVAGHYSPPFQHLLEMDHEDIRRRIEDAHPDVLLVSFGCPKQEKWIAMHYRALGVPVAIGVGATIDFLAGRAARAPRWMQQAGLEWVFRLGQEPRRLFRRYATDLWQFSRAILPQWWQMRASRAPEFSKQTPPPSRNRHNWRTVRISERLDVETVRRNGRVCEEALSVSRICLLDLSRVRFVDSTGMGLLIRLQKRARIAGRKLVLLSPSPAVQSCLRLMNLQDFFLAAPNRECARQLLQSQLRQLPVTVRPNYFHSKPAMSWQGEITAANVEEAWQTTRSFIAGRAKTAGRIIIDLAALQFIDSSGVGLMLRAARYAKKCGTELVFAAPQPNVRSVLRLANLESILLEKTK